MNQSVLAGVNANYQRALQNQRYANAAADKMMINSLSKLATLDLENISGDTTPTEYSVSGNVIDNLNPDFMSPADGTFTSTYIPPVVGTQS